MVNSKLLYRCIPAVYPGKSSVYARFPDTFLIKSWICPDRDVELPEGSQGLYRIECKFERFGHDISIVGYKYG